MTQLYIDTLNDLFKHKNSLYNDINYSRNNVNSISNTIIKLDELGYAFTDTDFNNFIICAIYKKSQGYIGSTVYANSKIQKEQVVKIMFTKFTPTDKQMKLLIGCYKSKGNFDWVDTLANKGYVFTTDQVDQLAKVGYNLAKIFKNKTNISLDQIKSSILTFSSFSKNELDDIRELIQNRELPKDFINWLLENLPIPSFQYPKIMKEYKALCSVFLERLSFDENSYNYIFRFKSCEFIYFCIDAGFIPENDSMIICATESKFIELVFYFHKKFKLEITTEIMNLIIKNQTKITREIAAYTYYNYINDKSSVKLMLSDFGYEDDIIESSVIDKYVSSYHLLRLLDVKPNEETLQLGFKKGIDEIINDCTKKFKMIPTSDHLKLLLRSCYINSNILSDLLCYKILPTKEDYTILIKEHHNINIEIVELLIRYGLVLDLDDIKMALSKKIIIENLERFNIQYDDKLYHLCYLNNMFPYDDKLTIDKNVLELRKLCRKPTITIDQLTKYMKDNSVMLDRYCFDHACYYNPTLFNNLLMIPGCKPTLAMYYWLGFSKCYFHHFDKYVETLGITQEYMSSKYEIEL